MKKIKSKTKHGKDKLILCSCRTYPSKSKVGPTQNISYFRDSVVYFGFIIASRVGQEKEEDERKKEEEMEGVEQQNKTRVVKVDSLESWDFYVTQATNQGTPVSFLINFTNFQTTIKLHKFFLLLSGS